MTNAEDAFTYTVNNEKLLDKDADVIDYSLIMLIKLLKDMEPKEIVCAGTDGYSATGPNYANEDMEYWFTRRKAEMLNQYVRNSLQEMESELKISFLTTSHYKR